MFLNFENKKKLTHIEEVKKLPTNQVDLRLHLQTNKEAENNGEMPTDFFFKKESLGYISKLRTLIFTCDSNRNKILEIPQQIKHTTYIKIRNSGLGIYRIRNNSAGH